MESRASCGTAIDIWPTSVPPTLAAVRHCLATCTAEPLVALHGGQAWVQRLVPCPTPALRALPSPPATTAAIQAGTAIVSGGTKGLGLQYARDAAAAGQRCLVLSSRNPALPHAELAALAASGAAVFVVRCSTADAGRCAQVAAWTREQLPRVSTCAHAAGAPGHDMLADINPHVWHRVVRPKVMARWLAFQH